MRRLLGLATVLVAVVAFPAAATAASPHLKNPNPLLFTDNGLTLTAMVSYAGLGNFDTVQTLNATATPTASCTNPAGATQPPGQNPASVNVTGSTAVPAADIKNGNVTITTTTAPPVTPIPGAPDCPNSQWTENITDMAFTSATITLSQNGVVVLTVNVTFQPADVARVAASATRTLRPRADLRGWRRRPRRPADHPAHRTRCDTETGCRRPPR